MWWPGFLAMLQEEHPQGLRSARERVILERQRFQRFGGSLDAIAMA
jgi:hypothetical protein